MAIGGDVIKTPHHDDAALAPEPPHAPVPESARVPKRDAGRRAFSPGRLRIISALAEALFSDETEQGLVAPPREHVARIADEFDLWIGAGSSDLGRGYYVLLALIEWLPFLITGTFGRASRLPLAQRLAYLERLERWPLALLATLVAAFKVPLTMLAFELDPELRVTGFDRVSVSTPRTIRRQLPLRASEPPKVQAR